MVMLVSVLVVLCCVFICCMRDFSGCWLMVRVWIWVFVVVGSEVGLWVCN